MLDIIRKLGRLFSSSTTSAAKIALSPGLLVRCFISIEQTRVVAIVPQIFLPTTTTTSDDHFFQTKKTTKDTKSNRTKPELREESFTVRWRRKEVLTVLSSLHILLDCCRQPCLPQQNSEEECESCATARVLPSSLLTSYRGEAFGSQDEALPNASLASKLSLSLSSAHHQLRKPRFWHLPEQKTKSPPTPAQGRVSMFTIANPERVLATDKDPSCGTSCVRCKEGPAN